MALSHHKDHQQRFDQQVENSREYVLPFIEKTKSIGKDVNVFEVGCGEGGVLLPFYERGCYCLGVDLDGIRIDLANDFLKEEIASGKMEFMCKNIFDADFLARFEGYFDVIILKDVIEHIPDQQSFVIYLKKLLKKEGQIFFGFPPWYMPFGGHQQLAEHKLGMMPWYHILPKPLYKAILKAIGENEDHIKELMEIYDTRISIERFEKVIRKSGLKVLNKQHYLINPIYKYKFGMKPRKQWKPITYLPYLRDFVTTCVYYTVG